jgi:acyl-CoA reductase-like NAD-dependent aldehyde dehydrogenase
MTSAQIEVKDYSYFADNQWRKAGDNQFFEVHEPYSGELFARVAAGSRADARVAVDAAAKAFAGWAETTPAEKARLFLKAAEIVKRRRTEIAEVLARETGSTISFATFQQDLVAATLQQVAGWVFLPKGEVLETSLPGTHSIGIRRPLGVVASFTPWSGANVLSWRAVISPVAAGNTVVVKPSEFAPVSAGIMLAEVAEEAGFPAGVINVVTHAPGAAGAIADEFFDRPEVRVINLIGGVKTARMLAERAGRLLKRTVMELGGFKRSASISFLIEKAAYLRDKENSHESCQIIGIRWAVGIQRCIDADDRTRRGLGEDQEYRRQSSGSREGLRNRKTDTPDRLALDTWSRVFRGRRADWQ